MHIGGGRSTATADHSIHHFGDTHKIQTTFGFFGQFLCAHFSRVRKENEESYETFDFIACIMGYKKAVNSTLCAPNSSHPCLLDLTSSVNHCQCTQSGKKLTLKVEKML